MVENLLVFSVTLVKLIESGPLPLEPTLVKVPDAVGLPEPTQVRIG